MGGELRCRLLDRLGRDNQVKFLKSARGNALHLMLSFDKVGMSLGKNRVRSEKTARDLSVATEEVVLLMGDSLKIKSFSK